MESPAVLKSVHSGKPRTTNAGLSFLYRPKLIYPLMVGLLGWVFALGVAGPVRQATQ